MTTKRLLNARAKSRKRWLNGLKKSNMPVPSDAEISIFETAYNMGYKIGRSHIQSDLKQLILSGKEDSE